MENLAIGGREGFLLDKIFELLNKIPITLIVNNEFINIISIRFLKLTCKACFHSLSPLLSNLDSPISVGQNVFIAFDPI